jgi:hypothetical protein
MTRTLAIICVFVIVIGLYSAWRYPHSARLEPQLVVETTDIATPEPETVTTPGPDPVVAEDGPKRPHDRSLDR